MKKGVKILGITLLVLLLIIFALPLIFKKQISDRVKQEINSQVNGQVNYGDLSFSFLAHFPNPTISLHNFSLIGPSSADNKIASIRNLNLTVDLGSMISGHNYKVISIFISDADFNLKVADDGRPEWNVLKYDVDFSKATKPEPGAQHADFSLQVNNWKIERTNIAFINDTTHTYFEVKGLNSAGTQLLDNGALKLQSTTTADGLSYTVGGISYLTGAKLNADIHFTAVSSTQLYTFADNLIQLNDLRLQLNGTIKSSVAGQDYNLKLLSADTSFRSLRSIIPGIQQGDDSSYAGGFNFSANILGVYHRDEYPAIAAALLVNKGQLKLLDPLVAKHYINLKATIVKPQGPLDSTVIDVSQLSIGTRKNLLNATLHITTPATNAGIEAQVTGGLDPAIIPGMKRDEKGPVSGLIVVLKISVHKNDIINKNYKDAQIAGGIKLLNCTYQTAEMPQAINIAQADCSVSNGALVLDKFTAGVGRNNFNGTGDIDHLLPWLSHQSHLAITVNLRSDVLYLSELIGQDKPVVAQKNTSIVAGTGTGSSDNKNAALGNLDVIVNATIKSAVYNQVVLQNLNGQLQVSGDNISIRKATAALADGRVSLTASSALIVNPAPVVNFNIGFNNISMQQVSKALKQGGVDVSSLQNINGNFSGELNGNGKLNADKSVNYRSIHADGKATCPDLKIDELPVLMDISRMAKVKSFEHMEAKNILCNFHFNNGKTTVDPTDVKFTTGTNINFKGVCDANQNLDADIALEVPVREFGQVGSLAQSLLGSFMKVPENMQFKFKVTGPMNKPAVNLASVGTSGN